MSAPDAPLRHYGLAYLIGAIALFLLTFAVAAALGHAGWSAAAFGAFLGLFAGGGLGLLVAARLDHPGRA
jgi:hypothetical protein